MSSNSDSDNGGPAQYSDDDDISYPDRTSVVSTGARVSKQMRQSRKPAMQEQTGQGVEEIVNMMKESENTPRI